MLEVVPFLYFIMPETRVLRGRRKRKELFHGILNGSILLE